VDGEYEQVNHECARQHDAGISQDRLGTDAFVPEFTNSPWTGGRPPKFLDFQRQ
jgi:hypothetical protein